MIKNSNELKISKGIVTKFNERLSYLNNVNDSSGTAQYEINAIQTMIKDINNQIDWFIRNTNNEVSYNSISSIDDLSTTIIGKRIQLGISEHKMAEALSISDDEYNFLEVNDFYGISKDMLTIILSMLFLSDEAGILGVSESSIKVVENSIKQLKVNQSVLNNYLPISFDSVKEAFKTHSSDAAYLLTRFLESFKDIFYIDLTEPISKDILNKSFAVAFKRRINTNEDQLNLISAFAARCAWIIAKQIPDVSVTMRADPIEIRREILSINNDVTLESCLRYIWNKNIGVLPLDVPRGFHGACFDFNNIKVIALNQQTKSVSRWKFDLLHELYHALTMDYNIYIERSDIMEQNNDEEENASLFASYIIFGSEMESYVKMVLDKSDGHAEFVKHSIISVSKQFNLNLDDFSYYFAYRTKKMFWGVAERLQQDNQKPNDIAKHVLFKYLNFSGLSDEDLYLLQKILMEGGNE